MTLPTFVLELIVALVGSGVGVLLALRLENDRERQFRRAHDLHQVQVVIDWIASRRALSRGHHRTDVFDEEDRSRCVASVLKIRERLERLTESLRDLDDAWPVLQLMEDDCASFLSWVERHPTLYVAGLRQLAHRLEQHEIDLKSSMPALVVVPPGSRDRDAPDWLPSS